MGRKDHKVLGNVWSVKGGGEGVDGCQWVREDRLGESEEDYGASCSDILSE